VVLVTVALELQQAWDEASQESGFHDPGALSLVGAEKARDKFYQLFFNKTGLHDALVRGKFNEWNTLPHEEAMQIQEKHGVGGFCAYLAEYVEKRASCGGMSTAYLCEDAEHGDDGNGVH
jgi:hypothetical protein